MFQRISADGWNINVKTVFDCSLVLARVWRRVAARGFVLSWVSKGVCAMEGDGQTQGSVYLS